MQFETVGQSADAALCTIGDIPDGAGRLANPAWEY
jgi:hypothetical protein